MKWFVTGLGMLLVIGAVTSARAQGLDLKGAPITIQGCVTSGIEPDTYVLTRVAEVKPDGTVIPRPPLPMPVVYWLDDVSGLKGRVGQRVQVGGKIERVHTSEVEVKQDDDAGLVAELEVPGRDVKTRASTIREVVGTSGEGTDVPTLVIDIDVAEVSRARGGCS